ncbi:cation-translocating P-type ATPase C-terminal domain-containing protein, partial [Mycoplasmopsis synoviae]
FNRQIYGNEFIILSATQLLIVNLLSHGLPAIALGIVKQEENVMLRKPYKTTDTIFSNGILIVLLRQSLIIAFYSLLAYGVVGLFTIINDLKGKEFVRLCSSGSFL